MISFALYWLAAGSVIWMFVQASGLLGDVAREEKPDLASLLIAHTLVIVAWPLVVMAFAKRGIRKLAERSEWQ